MIVISPGNKCMDVCFVNHLENYIYTYVLYAIIRSIDSRWIVIDGLIKSQSKTMMIKFEFE